MEIKIPKNSARIISSLIRALFSIIFGMFLAFGDGITGIQLVISALLSDKFVMIAPLDDASLLQDHDTVTVFNSRESVSDDKGGSALHQLIHAVLYNLLSTGIDGAGSLIQDQHRRIRYCGSGDGQKLSLSLA